MNGQLSYTEFAFVDEKKRLFSLTSIHVNDIDTKRPPESLPFLRGTNKIHQNLWFYRCAIELNVDAWGWAGQ